MAVNGELRVGQRRLVFGLNVLLQCVLALGVLVLAIAGAVALDRRVDFSSSGANSLSPRTRDLLRKLDEPVTVTALYSTLKGVRPFDEKRHNAVADLLGLYETAGRGRVTTRMLDPRKGEAAVLEIYRRLQDKTAYRDETRPHQEMIDRFPLLKAGIAELADAESRAIEQLAQSDLRFGQAPENQAIRLMLQDMLRVAARAEQEIKSIESSATPRKQRAVDAILDMAGSAREMLDRIRTWMTSSGAALSGISDSTAAFFREAPDRYTPVMGMLDEVLPTLQELRTPSVEDLFDRLVQGQTILIETADAAEVLSQDEVWPFRSPDDRTTSADGDPREFAGEQALSSAILKLTQKEKTGVVFVRAGGDPLLRPDFSRMNPAMMTQMPRAALQMMGELLERQNFVLEEWDVSAEPAPPRAEGVARRVLVIYGMPRANPMMPMMPMGWTPEQALMVQQEIEQGAGAIFMAGWQQAGSPPYAFEDYLRSAWGIGLRSNWLAIQFNPSPHQPGRWFPANRDPMLMTSDVMRFAEHEITRPLGSLPAAFHRVCPLQVLPDAGEGVTVRALVEVPQTESAWASENIMRIQTDMEREQGARPYSDDQRPPFPVALAASREDGRRIVVFASEQFAHDAVAQAQAISLTSAGLVASPQFPANSDLLINTVHWLAGEQDRISVGARRGDVPRLDRLRDGRTATFAKVFLVGVWPLMGLLAGLLVWRVRQN